MNEAVYLLSLEDVLAEGNKRMGSVVDLSSRIIWS